MNNNYFGSICEQNELKIWNWKSGELTQNIKMDEKIKEIDISSEFILLLVDDGFYFYNWLTKKLQKCTIINDKKFTYTCFLPKNNDVEIILGTTSGSLV